MSYDQIKNVDYFFSIYIEMHFYDIFGILNIISYLYLLKIAYIYVCIINIFNDSLCC